MGADPRRSAVNVSFSTARVVLATAMMTTWAGATELDYQAPPGCPSVEVMARSINERRLRENTESSHDARLRVRITSLGEVFSGQLILRQGGESLERTFEDRSCDDLVTALSLTAALAIDQYALHSGAVPPDEGNEASHGAPSSPAPPVPTAEAAPTKPGSSSEAARPGRSNAGFAVAAAAGAKLRVGVAPQALFGPAMVLSAGRHAQSWSALLGVNFLPARTFETEGRGASYSLLTAELGACWNVKFRFGDLGIPCLSLTGGALTAAGRGEQTNFSETVPWMDVGLFPELRVGGKLHLQIRAGIELPFFRHPFVFEAPDYLQHTTSQWTASLQIGLGYRVR